MSISRPRDRRRPTQVDITPSSETARWYADATPTRPVGLRMAGNDGRRGYSDGQGYRAVTETGQRDGLDQRADDVYVGRPRNRGERRSTSPSHPVRIHELLSRGAAGGRAAATAGAFARGAITASRWDSRHPQKRGTMAWPSRTSRIAGAQTWVDDAVDERAVDHAVSETRTSGHEGKNYTVRCRLDAHPARKVPPPHHDSGT